MMKLPHSACCLPLLLGALALPSAARPAKNGASDAASDPLRLGAAQGRRVKARSLSNRGQWPSAAAEWRAVLLELHRAEQGDTRPAQRLAIQEMRREAEGEVWRARGHLAAFWSVRDMVTTGVDSRNSPPSQAAQTRRVAAAPTVLSSAARPPVAPSKRSRAERKPAASNEVFVSGLTFDPDAAGPREARGSRATLRWARAQWWTQPLVQSGADSLNPTLLALPSTPLRAPSPPSVRATATTSSELKSWPLPIAEQVAAPVSEAPTRRSWTMHILLPSAREAELAAQSHAASHP